MGVSGCGKTTLGKAFSKKVGLPFFDADDFHAVEHIEKMRKGNALTDEDRVKWLDKIGRRMSVELADRGAVLACSALKYEYRRRLAHAIGQRIVWVYLKGSPQVISNRLIARKNHYFHVSLLASQFEILEEPLNAVHLDCQLDTDAQLGLLCQILGFQ